MCSFVGNSFNKLLHQNLLEAYFNVSVYAFKHIYSNMMKKSNKQVTETKTSRTIYGNKISISVKCVAYKQILFDKRFEFIFW